MLLVLTPGVFSNTTQMHVVNMADDDDQVDKVLNTFAELGLNQWLVDQCQAVGMKKPTPIQMNCVPEIIKGKRGRAQTSVWSRAIFG